MSPRFLDDLLTEPLLHNFFGVLGLAKMAKPSAICPLSSSFSTTGLVRTRPFLCTHSPRTTCKLKTIPSELLRVRGTHVGVPECDDA